MSKNTEVSNPEVKKETAMTKVSTSPIKSLEALMGKVIKANDDVARGLANLATLPDISAKTCKIEPIFGYTFERGVVGFRRDSSTMTLAIACGKAQVRYISLEKYIALVEQMNDPEGATIVLQNPTDKDNFKSARGQILCRINPKFSAVIVVLGVAGRIIKNKDDVASVEVYFLDRAEMSSYFLAAKAQLSTQNTLENMIAAYEGWREFEIPLDPLSAFGLAGEDAA
jgi:hypothetical protein